MNGVTLGQAAIEQLAEVKRRVDRLWAAAGGNPTPVRPMLVPGLHVAKTGGTAITAVSGSTAGSGTVTLQKLSSGSLGNRTDNSGAAVTVTAYSFVGEASGTNAYIFVAQDVDGNFWYIAEACPA